MYYRWPVTATRTGFVVIPFLLQWVQNLMVLTTRRFVFPAFRQPLLNKNQSLVALKAGFLSPSSSQIRAVSLQRRAGLFTTTKAAGFVSFFWINSPSPTGWLPVFITQLSVECLVEEETSSRAYNATSRTSPCARSVVTWPNTWWLFSFWRSPYSNGLW